MSAKTQAACGCGASLEGVGILRHEADADRRRYCSVRCLQRHHLVSWEQVRELRKSERSNAWPYAEHHVQTNPGPCHAQCALCGQRYDSPGEVEVKTAKPWFRGWCPRCVDHVNTVVNSWLDQGVEGSKKVSTAVVNGAKPGKEFLAVPDEDLAVFVEEKRTISGYPHVMDGYVVSNTGRVWSPNGRELSRLAAVKSRQAYVSLRRSDREDQSTSYRVAVLVLEAFVSKKPSGKEVLYKDGNPDNCNLSNLSWAKTTHPDLVQERRRHAKKSAATRAASRKVKNRPGPKPKTYVAPRGHVEMERTYRSGAVAISVNDDNLGTWPEGLSTPQDRADMLTVLQKVSEMDRFMGLI